MRNLDLAACGHLAETVGLGVAEEDRFLAEAIAIGDRVLAHRARARDGSLTWVGPVGYGTDLNPVRTGKLTPYLYDGAAGIALFLAALEAVRGGGEYGPISLQTLEPLRRKMKELLADPERALRAPIPIGGLTGIGALIYAFLRVAEWLGEESLAAEAHQLTALLTPERIEQDERVRIQTGSSGAILALLALQRRDPGPNRDGQTPLALALRCGEHLMRTRLSHEGLPPAWPLSPGKPPLIGFCYGAAGTAYALLRLYEATGREDVLDAALGGLAYVRAFFSAEERGWRDIRASVLRRYEAPAEGTWKDWWASGSPQKNVGSLQAADEESPADISSQYQNLNMWCHGGAGITLGRIAALSLIDGPEVREEIAAGLDQTTGYDEPGRFATFRKDDLCCGHMGRVEVLHEASRRLKEPHYFETARSLALRVLDRADEEGRYELSAARGTGEFSPNLFQGAAGIGYTLLRLVAPDALPCLLLLE